jgi:hypothetical protein
VGFVVDKVCDNYQLSINLSVMDSDTCGLIRYCFGVGTQGDPCTMTTVDLLHILICFLIIPDSSTRALWQLPAETSSTEAGETWQKMANEFCL